MNMKIPEYLQEDDMNEAMPIPPDVVDFSEYMWMADGLEEFDRAVEEEFWEEAFMEACFEQMLAEEEAQWMYYTCQQETLNFSFDSSQKVDRCSKLNPDAPEFVPRCATFKFT